MEQLRRDAKGTLWIVQNSQAEYNFDESDIQDEKQLPSNWDKFLSIRQNKTYLIKYVTQSFLKHTKPYLQNFQTLCVAGVGTEAFSVDSSGTQSAPHLSGNHDEADTRIFLHIAKCPYTKILVFSKDTDVPHIGLSSLPSLHLERAINSGCTYHSYATPSYVTQIFNTGRGRTLQDYKKYVHYIWM